MANEVKTAFSRLVTATGEVTNIVVSDEDKLRIVVSNADSANVILVKGKILDQDDWDLIQTITANTKESLNISTYDYVMVECTVYDSLSTYVKVIASSFNSAGGSTEIGAPTGDLTVKDADLVQFTSSDNSVTITGNNTTKTIDFVSAGGADVGDLITLSGVASGSTDLGTFTGTTIPNSSDNKEALQALETAVEGKEPAISTGNSMQYRRGDKTWQTLDTSVVFENVQLYFTDDRARTAAVSDSVTDGVTNIAPSQNAVFEALEEKLSLQTGDILQTSFSALNNQITPVDITGLLFSSVQTQGFKVLITVLIITDTINYYETFDLTGAQISSGYVLNSSSVGDDSGVLFSITSSGQVQYTSTNLPDFVSNTIKFRAITLSV